MNHRAPRIIIVSWHFPPSSEVAGKVVWRLARRLALRGADVRVLTPPAAEALALDERYGAAAPVGLRVITVPAWPDPISALLRARSRLQAILHRSTTPREALGTGTPPALPSANTSGGFLRRVAVTLRRLPDEAGRWIVPAARALRRSLRDEPADLVITASPVFSAHVIALRAGLPAAATSWYAWSHDPMVGNPFKAETTDWWHRLVGRWDAEIVARASRLLVTTRALQADFVNRYPGSRTPELLPCGFEPDEVPTLPPPPTTGPLILSHVGTLYGHRSPAPILESVARLRSQGLLTRGDLALRFVGADENAAEESLESAIARLGLGDMVTATPPVSQVEALRVVGSSSAGLLLAERQPLQIPAKTFEYVGLRRPIFALTDGATADLIRETGIGVASEREHLDQALLDFVGQWKEDSLARYRAALDRVAHQYEADALAAGVLALLARDREVA